MDDLRVLLRRMQCIFQCLVYRQTLTDPNGISHCCVVKIWTRIILWKLFHADLYYIQIQSRLSLFIRYG